jgi:hypothetical protein
MHDTEQGPGRPDADECQRQIAESAAFLTAFTPQHALWRESIRRQHGK